MADGAGPHTAFFYGTLMSPEVLYRVIYGTISPDTWQTERLNIQPGLLYDYRRHRVKGADYPAICPLIGSESDHTPESQRVLGTIVRGLSDMDIMRLDLFEGDQYTRDKVEAYPLQNTAGAANHIRSAESTVQVQTYVWDQDNLSDLESEEWDYEEFKREKLRYWAGSQVMRDDYEVVDTAVANGEVPHDGTGGRGVNGKITKQLVDLKDGIVTEEPLQSAV